MSIPAHITVPKNAKFFHLAHKRLDLSVFSFADGKKKLCMTGKPMDVVEPEKELRGFAAHSDKVVRDVARVLFRADV